MSEDPKRPSKLGMTTPQNIVVSVVAGAILGFAILRAFDAAATVVPLVPWSVTLALVLCAIAAFIYSRSFTKRLEANAMTAQEGLIAVVVGKSMLMTGAVLAGGHLVYIMAATSQFDVPGPRARVIHGAMTLVASLAFALAGSAIERACSIDASDPDADNQGGQPA